MTDYASLIQHADHEQEKLLLALMSTETMAQAAIKLDINQSNVTRRLAVLRQKAQRLDKKPVKAARIHAMIPDCQVTPETPTDHLEWIGQYLADIQPDVIVNIGDFADMEALSSYDYGKKAAEGRRVLNDFDAANKAMRLLMKPIQEAKDYSPELHMTMGNHEYRVVRAVECDAKLDGFLSLDALNYKDMGYTVHPFLTPVEIDGVNYIHFVPNPNTGKPYGGFNMDTRLKTVGYSFTMGHQQMHMYGSRALGNGKILKGLVSGACYLHDEDYKGKMGNTYWRGIVIKHEVFDGSYDLMEVSLDYLCRRYEGIPLSEFMAKKYPDIFHRSIWLNRLASRGQ